jgi:putative peptide zinc metalloprotease protein
MNFLLPALREDLNLAVAAPDRDGAPAWTIHDAIGNRFFRIGWVEFCFLSRWRTGGDAASLLARVASETTLRPSLAQLVSLVNFLHAQQLVRADRPEAVQHLVRLHDMARESVASWLLHHYLFFRIPLLRPAAWLRGMLPRLGWVYSRVFLGATVAAAALGLVLASRQWDTFVHSLVQAASFEGLSGWVFALIGAKALHELGHALTATRYGVRVPQMGVAFLVMWPMLYTDTSEVWKLSDRRQRFNVAAAGMAAEFALAAWATFAWSVVTHPELRSALFFLATTSWVLTLFVNASPFMRFDGYFLLSDALDLPNLHARAGGLAQTWLRRSLLGWDEPWPEVFTPRLHRFLIVFALVTWVYRLVMFFAIALAVYHFFFKLLGLFLFVVEIVWFIGRPVAKEWAVWWARRAEIRSNRRYMAGLLMLIALLIMAWPWRTTVRAEGWLHAERQQLIFSPVPAQLGALRSAGPIAAGDLIARLDAPEARGRAAQSTAMADALTRQLDQTIGRSDGHERRAVIAEQLGSAQAEVAAQRAELGRLSLRAPFSGVLLDHDPDLQPGTWVNGSQPLAMLVDPRTWVVDALVEQSDLDRIAPGAPARVYRRGRLQAPIAALVASVDSSRASVLPHAMLSRDHGGRVATVRLPDGRLAPRDGLYRVRLKLQAPLTDTQVGLGSVEIDAAPRSLLRDLGRGLVALWVRETGF